MKWQGPQIKLFQPFHFTGALASSPPIQERTPGALLGSAAPAPSFHCHCLKGHSTFPRETIQLQTSKETSYHQQHWIRPVKRPWSFCQDTGSPVTTVTLLQRPPGGSQSRRWPRGWHPPLGFCAFGVLPALLCSDQVKAPPSSTPGSQPPLPPTAWQWLRADYCLHLPLCASERDVTELWQRQKATSRSLQDQQLGR